MAPVVKEMVALPMFCGDWREAKPNESRVPAEYQDSVLLSLSRYASGCPTIDSHGEALTWV